MKKYRDGDRGYDIIRPGERMPGEYVGPAEGGDFGWLRPSPWERFRNRGKGKSLKILNDNLGLATDYNRKTAEHIRSKHDIAHAQNEGQLLPLKFEQEQSQIQLGILRNHGAMADELERRERARQEHKLKMIQLKGGRKSAKARNKQEQRARRRGRQPIDHQPEPPTSGPAAFNRHYRTVQEANMNRWEGERRIQEIYGRAAAAKRQLTPEELEEVDAIDDAARAAADEVRRTGASDLPPEGDRR